MTWTGTSIAGRQYSLFRAYAFTDSDCVNVVFRGAVVGGPAYAPRMSGPLKLPTSDTDSSSPSRASSRSAPKRGRRRSAPMAPRSSTNETAAAADSQARRRHEHDHDHDDVRLDAQRHNRDTASTPRKVDLPDLNFPTTRYFWTRRTGRADRRRRRARSTTTTPRCRRTPAPPGLASFGKESAPVTTTAGTPYVVRPLAQRTSARVGHAQAGRLRHPARRLEARDGGRRSYEVQWSQTLYPWQPGRLEDDLLDVNRAQPQARTLVLPCPRTELQRAASPVHALVDAGAGHRREADLPDPRLQLTVG